MTLSRSEINKINASKRGSISGANNPNFGNKWTEKQKLDMHNKMINRYDGKNNPFYKKHHSKETKKLLSVLKLGMPGIKWSDKQIESFRTDKIGRKNPMYGVRGINAPMYGRKGKLSPSYGKLPAHSKRIHYTSPFQGTICFRSSWEAAYAKYLDSTKELWFYEIETFELSGEETYTPDFFLPRMEKFIEIKGRMWNEGSIKFEKFKEEYPFDIEILFKQDLKELGVI